MASDLNRKYRMKPFWVGNLPIQYRSLNEPSAVIQIEDNNGGFLTSRLTTTQRDAIISPTDGVMIWNTDTLQLEVYVSGSWTGLSGGGGGAVASVFGRTGNVIAVSGDYTASQITNVPLGNLTSIDVQAALYELQTDIDLLGTPANAISPAANDAVGAVGGNALEWAREDHKHPAQGVSVDAGNSITIGTDGLHFTAALSTPANAISPAANDAVGAVGVNLTEWAREDHKHPAQGVSTDIGNSITIGTDGLHFATAIASNPANAISPAANDAVGAVGVNATEWAREDHKHPAQGVSTDIGNSITIGTDGLHFASSGSPAIVVSPAANDAIGSVGISLLYARQDHKHPAQGVSTDAGNSITIGTDGLHFANSAKMTTFQAPPNTYGAGFIAPVNPPVAPIDGDIHLEVYDDYIIWWERNGGLWVASTKYGGQDRQFALNSGVAPAIIGSPTIAEITAFVSSNGWIDTLVYYTADDLPASPIQYVYLVDQSGTVTEIARPAISGIPLWAPNTTYATGQPVITPAGDLVTAVTTFTSGLFFDIVESGAWQRIGQVDILPWAVNTYYYLGTKATTRNVTMRRNLAGVSNGFIFDPIEAGLWDYVSQESIDPFIPNIIVLQNELVDVDQILYQRIAAAATALVFDATERANYTQLTNGPPSEIVLANFLADWSPSGPSYIHIIPTAIHGKLNPRMVQTYINAILPETGINDNFAQIEKIKIDPNGDVTIFVTQAPDNRFEGSIMIS